MIYAPVANVLKKKDREKKANYAEVNESLVTEMKFSLSHKITKRIEVRTDRLV
jgi:hypothetical protein